MKLMRKKGMKGLRWCHATLIPYPRPPSPLCPPVWVVWREESGSGVCSGDSLSEFEVDGPGTLSVSMSQIKAGPLLYLFVWSRIVLHRSPLGSIRKRKATHKIPVVLCPCDESSSTFLSRSRTVFPWSSQRVFFPLRYGVQELNAGASIWALERKRGTAEEP